MKVISHTVWLYHCLLLSFRESELLLPTRGVVGAPFDNGTRSLAQPAEPRARGLRQMALREDLSRSTASANSVDCRTSKHQNNCIGTPTSLPANEPGKAAGPLTSNGSCSFSGDLTPLSNATPPRDPARRRSGHEQFDNAHRIFAIALSA